MDYKIDKLGNKIAIQQFSNLKEKTEICRGYVMAYNGMVEKQNAEAGYLKHPMLSLEHAVEKIVKQHQKFYGEDNKYDSKGVLKNA